MNYAIGLISIALVLLINLLFVTQTYIDSLIEHIRQTFATDPTTIY